MLISDFQFLKYLLLKELDIEQSITDELLNKEIVIQNYGSQDEIVIRSGQIIYTNPSSLLLFLFKTSYTLLCEKITESEQKDKVALVLIQMCKDYLYDEYTEQRTKNCPPLLMSFNKFPVPLFILNTIIEPLLSKKLNRYKILCMPCHFTDVCRTVTSTEVLSKHYSNISKQVFANDDFPLILLNASVYNNAAQSVHLLIKILEMNLGEDETQNVLKNVLLNKKDHLSTQLITVLKTLNNDPVFVFDFFKYLSAHLALSKKDDYNYINHYAVVMQSDAYLGGFVKTSSDGKYTPSIWRQWDQFSMLMGLIEKQLGSFRGSMWPTTEQMKPHDQEFKLMIKTRQKEKNKNQLNFEELLEVAREHLNHNAIEPGKLSEVLLKDNRLWN